MSKGDVGNSGIGSGGIGDSQDSTVTSISNIQVSSQPVHLFRSIESGVGTSSGIVSKKNDLCGSIADKSKGGIKSQDSVITFFSDVHL